MLLNKKYNLKNYLCNNIYKLNDICKLKYVKKCV